MPVHEWTHVVVSYDGANEYHYINGGLAETGSCPGDPSASLKLDKHPEKRLKIGARGAYPCTTPDAPENCVPTQDAYSQVRGDIDEVGARSPKSKPLRLPRVPVVSKACRPLPGQGFACACSDHGAALAGGGLGQFRNV